MSDPLSTEPFVARAAPSFLSEPREQSLPVAVLRPGRCPPALVSALLLRWARSLLRARLAADR